VPNIDILETFLAQQGEIGIKETARMSAVDIATAYRIVSDPE
jgi:hypothetical protein